MSWLRDAFGFTFHFIKSDAGRMVHGQMRLGRSLIFIGPDNQEPDIQDGELGTGLRSQPGTSQCVYIAIAADIDAHYLQAQAAGAEIISSPHNTAYGSREYSCRDHEGHLWMIGNYHGEP